MRAADVFEIDVDALRGCRQQSGCEVLGGLVVDGHVNAQLLLEELHLIRTTGRGDDLVTL